MDELICKFCKKVCKNSNSHRNHERLCPENKDRVYKNGMIGKLAWNKGLTTKTDIRLKKLGKNVSMALSGKPGHKHNEATKKNLSEIAKKNEFGGHNSKNQILYNGVKLHSSYELKVAIDLDKNNIKWIRPKPLYWVDDKEIKHRYYADFYLPDYDLYLDPKNDFLINNINPAFGITDCEKIEKVMEQNKVKVLILNSQQLEWNYIIDCIR